MSRAQNRRDAEMSPGNVNPSSAASAALAARPIPVSSIPPHHTGHAAVAAQVVDAPSRQVAADPAGLDVDDLGGAQLDGVGGDGQRDDRLVEAHRRADRPGQLGVAEQVVLGERLLDEQEVELVEPGQVLDVLAGVRGVGIDLQRHVGTDQPADLRRRARGPNRARSSA